MTKLGQATLVVVPGNIQQGLKIWLVSGSNSFLSQQDTETNQDIKILLQNVSWGLIFLWNLDPHPELSQSIGPEPKQRHVCCLTSECLLGRAEISKVMGQS